MTIKNKLLADCIDVLESGGRPKGGGTTLGDIPSIGGEHLNNFGGFKLGSMKYIPLNFYNGMNSGKITPNDILIVKDGATTGKVSFVNGKFPYKDSAVNEHVFIVRTNKKVLDSKYAFYFLHSDIGFNQIMKDFRGSAQGGISREFINKIVLPIPDLKTQQKIASILDKIDTARQNRKLTNHLTEQFLQSAFLEMFGDPVGNEKGWEMKNIDFVVSKIISGWSAPSEQRLKQGNELGVLKVSAVTYGVFKPEEHKAVLKENVKQNLVHPVKGDVLMTRANTREMVAACCIVDKDYNDLFLSDKHWKVIIKRDFITAEFFRYVIMSDSYHENLANKSTGTSGSMFNISKDKLLNSKFPVPPIHLQQKFVTLVERITQLREKQRECEQNLNNLFASFMNKYFR